MKRHVALHRLSREHSPALSLARRLLQADTADRMALAQANVRSWLPDLLQHFDDEEAVLQPLLRQLGDSAGAERLGVEHDALRAGLTHCATFELNALINHTTISTASLAAASAPFIALGELLRDHVHFEERQLFPLLEQRLTNRQWQAVAVALTPTGAS